MVCAGGRSSAGMLFKGECSAGETWDSWASVLCERRWLVLSWKGKGGRAGGRSAHADGAASRRGWALAGAHVGLVAMVVATR